MIWWRWSNFFSLLLRRSLSRWTLWWNWNTSLNSWSHLWWFCLSISCSLSLRWWRLAFIIWHIRPTLFALPPLTRNSIIWPSLLMTRWRRASNRRFLSYNSSFWTSWRWTFAWGSFWWWLVLRRWWWLGLFLHFPWFLSYVFPFSLSHSLSWRWNFLSWGTPSPLTSTWGWGLSQRLCCRRWCPSSWRRLIPAISVSVLPWGVIILTSRGWYASSWRRRASSSFQFSAWRFLFKRSPWWPVSWWTSVKEI